MHIIATANPWKQEKLQLEKYYKTVFDYTIDWKKFKLPEKTDRLQHLVIKPKEMTANHIFYGITACKSFIFKKRIKIIEDIDKALTLFTCQPRPSDDYAWADEGGQRPDVIHRGKSYEQAIKEGFPFMGPVEYMLSNAEYEFRNKRTYDERSLTRLSVANPLGHGMVMFWLQNRGLFMSSVTSVGSNPISGPREIILGA